MGPVMKRTFRLAGLVVGLATLVMTGVQIVPTAIWVLRLRQAADDPVALAALRLSDAVTVERIGAEVEAAVAEGDEELATSFLTLAQAEGLPVAPAWREKVDQLQRTETLRATRDFASGFAVGETDTMAGLAGAFAGDLVGYGDVRDLWREGSKLAQGEAYDEIVLGMSVVGLAVTGVTWASIGTSAPARAGLTAVKTAKKAGRLSKPLAATLARTTREMIDGDAVHAAVKAARRLDLDGTTLAARTALRPSAVGKLKHLSDNAATLYARTGHRGVMQVLSIAEDADDVRRAARLSAGMGSKTRAVLKVLGRGALVLGSAFASLVQWVWAALTWAFVLAMFARKFGLILGQLIWPRRADRRAGGETRARAGLYRAVPTSARTSAAPSASADSLA
jgi:hypothetical protein